MVHDLLLLLLRLILTPEWEEPMSRRKGMQKKRKPLGERFRRR